MTNFWFANTSKFVQWLPNAFISCLSLPIIIYGTFD